jgi:hypothetical protein
VHNMTWGPFDPEWADVFFNGRPAKKREPQPPVSGAKTITLQQLIEHRRGTIRVGEKYYQFVITEVEKP